MKKVTLELLKSKNAYAEGLKWFVEWWGEKAEVRWSVCWSAYNSIKPEWGEWLEDNIKPLLEPQLSIKDIKIDYQEINGCIVVRVRNNDSWCTLVTIMKEGTLQRYSGFNRKLADEYGIQLDEKRRIKLEE